MKARIFVPFLAVIALTACAGPARTPPPPGANANLSGFPPPFREGYRDGCSSAGGDRVRDEARFKSDSQYASGWRDGNDICSRRR
jgi:hypothetical protein